MIDFYTCTLQPIARTSFNFIPILYLARIKEYKRTKKCLPFKTYQDYKKKQSYV